MAISKEEKNRRRKEQEKIRMLDPEYRERKRIRAIISYHKRKSDPEVIKRKHEKYVERMSDPENRRKKQEYDKKRLSDPVIKKTRAEYAKGWHAERSKDPEVQKKRKEYLQRPEVIERRRERSRENYAKNIQDPEYRKKKNEKDRFYGKKYYASEDAKEKRKAYVGKYYEDPKNKDKRKTYNERYINKPGKKELKAEYKKKFMAGLSQERKAEMNRKSRDYQRKARGTKGVCEICGFDEIRALATHHIVERSKGGLDIPSNTITVCANCHQLIHAGKIDITEHI